VSNKHKTTVTIKCIMTERRMFSPVYTAKECLK